MLEPPLPLIIDAFYAERVWKVATAVLGGLRSRFSHLEVADFRASLPHARLVRRCSDGIVKIEGALAVKVSEDEETSMMDGVVVGLVQQGEMS